VTERVEPISECGVVAKSIEPVAHLWRSWFELSERPRRSIDGTAQLRLIDLDLGRQ